jgi:MATE family multidrug resistance protein
LEQSQLALAQTVYNITGLSLVVGIASGVQTFVGAANGAGASSLKGVILQRGVVLTLLTCLVPLLGWRWLPALMALLGQDPLLASGAARYIWHVCPALPLSALIYAMSFYLQAQHVIWPLVGAMAASVSLVPLLLHLYIDRAGWDALAGAAAAVLTMNVVEVSLLMAVVVWHNKR